jgi:pyruvate dehydrogenase complex dehydrogenase (E1) component
VTAQLRDSAAPVIAVSDYIRTLPESIRGFVPAPYVTLGTDGFGRSDTRVNLRDFFEIDARWIAYTALCEVWGMIARGLRMQRVRWASIRTSPVVFRLMKQSMHR